MNLSSDLFFNFWIWWYYFNMLRVIQYLRQNIIVRAAVFTGLDVNVRYFFKPLYQDYTTFGRLFSLFVRTILVGFGFFVQLIALVITVTMLIAYLILPVYPLIEIWSLIVTQN